MTPNANLTLATSGVLVCLQINAITETAVDCVLCIDTQLPNVDFHIESIPFFMRRQDFTRWAMFIEDQIARGGDPDPFVTYDLGFQFSILDADDYESTVLVLLNVGMAKDSRVYSGSETQVKTENLLTFAHGLRVISQDVPER